MFRTRVMAETHGISNTRFSKFYGFREAQEGRRDRTATILVILPTCSFLSLSTFIYYLANINYTHIFPSG